MTAKEKTDKDHQTMFDVMTLTIHKMPNNCRRFQHGFVSLVGMQSNPWLRSWQKGMGDGESIKIVKTGKFRETDVNGKCERRCKEKNISCALHDLITLTLKWRGGRRGTFKQLVEIAFSSAYFAVREVSDFTCEFLSIGVGEHADSISCESLWPSGDLLNG